RRDGRASAWWLLAPLAIVAASVRWFYPLHFGGDRGLPSIRVVEGQVALVLSGHELFLSEFDGRGFRSVLHNLWSYDPILLVASAAGAAFLAARLLRRRAAIAPDLGKDLLVFLGQAL